MLDRWWIAFTPDDNGTVMATCADLPEVTTFGLDEAQAFDRARDAIQEALAARIADWSELPDSRDQARPGELPLHLPAQIALKLYLYAAVRQAGVNRAELARRLGWHREQVDRLFRLDHASRLDQLEAALTQLGLRLRFEAIAAEA